MTQPTLITNTPRDYAWGMPGGIAALLGQPGHDRPEAELWLGAHPGSPARAVGAQASWRDLAEWEATNGRTLPFLLKLLSAAHPLSLQVHPSREQARSGFEREDAAGIPRDAPRRNYRDPFAKPEIIVALHDGFEALCGFREPSASLVDLDALAGLGCRAGLGRWRELLCGADPLRTASAWLLSGDPEVSLMLDELTRAAAAAPDRFAVVAMLAEEYPGDPGIAVALMLNRVELRKGEALWLPAGNMHAYLRGNGVELMGPSDNVLRCGLTGKHVDRDELQRVAEFVPITPPRLAPEPVGETALTYRPASTESGRGVGFQLLRVGGDLRVEIGSPAIAVCLGGCFKLAAGGGCSALNRGEAAFVDVQGTLSIDGQGELYVALGSSTSPRLR